MTKKTFQVHIFLTLVHNKWSFYLFQNWENTMKKKEDINYLPWPALCYLICFPQLLFWYQVSHFPLLPEFLKKEGFIWGKK